jgi:hypothetical protein
MLSKESQKSPSYQLIWFVDPAKNTYDDGIWMAVGQLEGKWVGSSHGWLKKKQQKKGSLRKQIIAQLR